MEKKEENNIKEDLKIIYPIFQRNNYYTKNAQCSANLKDNKTVPNAIKSCANLLIRMNVRIAFT
jgi:hypothetical protein